ncbi:MAG: hypothetical protein RLZZ628_4473, partial [Bacteroidota bacterium]
CPCCKKLRFCFELEVMPSKIAELNDLANQCQQDIDMVLTCGAHPNWDYELINMVSSDLEDESYDYYIEDCFLQNPLRVTWLTECKFKMVMQCIKMGGNALINMNYAVGKNQFLDIRMLTATAIKIKPSASFKLSDKILDSITALERLWDEA